MGPLILTEFGKTVAEATNAREWAKRAADQLMTETRGKEPFEIDAAALNHVEQDPTRTTRRLVGKAAYEHGTTASNIQNVLRICLRDELLGRHGLTVPKKTSDNEAATATTQ